MEEFAARFIGALVGVRAEVVALGLQQVGGQAFGGVAVEEGNRGSHAGHGDAAFDGFGDDSAPCGQAVFQYAFEIGVGTQEHQIGIGFVCVADVAQERAADDA